MYIPFRIKPGIKISLLDSIAIFFIRWNYLIKNTLIRTLVGLLFKRPAEKKVKKILILRMGGMGDTITALPAFSAIKDCFPDAIVDLLTNKFQPGKARISEILPSGYFKETYFYEKFVDKPLVNQLKSRKYDLFIELTNYDCSLYFELRSIRLAISIGAPAGLGWFISSDFFLKSTQTRSLYFDTNRVRLLSILKYYGLIFKDRNWLLENNGVSLPELDSGILNIQNQKSIGNIAIVIGTSWPENQWPVASFKKVAEYFVNNGYEIVFIGGSQDFEACENIINPVGMINLCGKLSVLQTASVLKLCKLAIGNDTGPMHLAYACGTAVIMLFSNKDYPGQWYPPESRNNFLLSTPVYQKIESITVKQVIDGSEKILVTI